MSEIDPTIPDAPAPVMPIMAIPPLEIPLAPVPASDPAQADVTPPPVDSTAPDGSPAPLEAAPGPPDVPPVGAPPETPPVEPLVDTPVTDSSTLDTPEVEAPAEKVVPAVPGDEGQGGVEQPDPNVTVEVLATEVVLGIPMADVAFTEVVNPAAPSKPSVSSVIEERDEIDPDTGIRYKITPAGRFQYADQVPLNFHTGDRALGPLTE